MEVSERAGASVEASEALGERARNKRIKCLHHSRCVCCVVLFLVFMVAGCGALAEMDTL
jgi:hypothetical protein